MYWHWNGFAFFVFQGDEVDKRSVFLTFFQLDSLLKRVVQKLVIQPNTKTMFVYLTFDPACCCFRCPPPPILNSSGCVAATHSAMFCVFCSEAKRLSDPLAYNFLFCYNNFKARQFSAAIVLFFVYNLYFKSSSYRNVSNTLKNKIHSTVFSDKSSNDE